MGRGGTQHLVYKLLAMDLDGTLIGNDLLLSERVKQAVARAQAAGVRAVLATGRMVRATLPYAQELGITAPLICYQGALMRDITADRTLYERPVPQELARQAIAEAEGR